MLGAYDLRLNGPPENLPLSRRTQNILVPTQEGKKVLKKYRPMLPKATIAYSHSILEALAKINFPAIRLVTNEVRDTREIHAGAHYSLSSFVAGNSY